MDNIYIIQAAVYIMLALIYIAVMVIYMYKTNSGRYYCWYAM
jgi:hypothetical protein